ncbi:hypothetical protein BC941DRAFT_476106 [Chlamydoabsidia padenii]|nr:hypothetical protein BC941DRAFT_476106 [Chlamydoabsidia padenii]
MNMTTSFDSFILRSALLGTTFGLIGFFCMLETDNEKYIDIMNNTNPGEEATNLTAGSILFRLASPLIFLSLKNNKSSCEDNFVHHYIDDVLDGDFSQEPLSQQECPLPTSTPPTRTQQQQQ